MNLVPSFLDILQKQHKQLSNLFEQEMVIGGKVVPRGSILLFPTKYKDTLVNIFGHVVPLGEIKRLPGDVLVNFTDLVDGDQMLIIPNHKIGLW